MQTIGFHLVKSGYGLWLPGDCRGHWLAAWDEQIGYYEPHQLHGGDPNRERMARERMKHPVTRFTTAMVDATARAMAACVAASPWQVAAAAIESTHMHLLITYTPRDIHAVAKWIVQQTTKAVHGETDFSGPLWCEGKWLTFVFDEEHWENTRQYIERHNLRRGLPAQPWDWITPDAR
ncbi:MAG TPA: transposase [Pirellulales bacterium]|jgi:REP element-mobilizing transposase RayT|nr:transposase [Pirellulales bacterium]